MLKLEIQHCFEDEVCKETNNEFNSEHTVTKTFSRHLKNSKNLPGAIKNNRKKRLKKNLKNLPKAFL